MWRIIVSLTVIALLGGWYLVSRGLFETSTEVDVALASFTYPSQANAVLTASGYVVAQQKASVASKGTGRLEFLGVEEGDRVKEGEVIARLEDADVVASLAKAKADLEVVIADSLDAAQSLERQERLHKSKLTSEAELVAAEARYRRVVASIKSAHAAVAAAQVAVEYTRIRAPFDGTVLAKHADVGEVVAPFASSASSRGAVVTVADMSSMEVEADVSESNITRVKIGQPCEIMLDAYPDKRYQGYVHKIVPTADRAKATVLTKVRFKDRDERVLPEMSAKVTFLADQPDPASSRSSPTLTIPLSSVVTRDGREAVYSIHNETVTETTVKTGERFADRIEIKEGLAQGDKVVLRPGPGLTSGSRVKIKSD